MRNVNPKQLALQLSLCAGIIGVAGIFIWNGMGALAVSAVAAAAVVLLLNLALRGAGTVVTRKRGAPKWAARTGSALLAVLTVLVSVYGLLYMIQDSLLFYQVTDPESREFLRDRPGYSEVAFTAENGRDYHGVMYRAADGDAPLVIYFGGNGEVSHRHMRNREEQGRWAYFAGYSYLVVDYDGYGLNDGRTNQASMYEGALAAYDYAAALPHVDRIVAMGYSLGTGSAVYLAAQRPVAGLILAAPYANGYDLYNNMFPLFFGPMRGLVKHPLPSEEYAPKAACPALIFASRGDEAIPFSSSERLSGLFPGPVDFVALDHGVYHNDIFGVEGVYDRVQYFLEEVASK